MPEQHALYMNAASAPCRAVLLHHHLVADAFGPLELIEVDLANREYTPNFLQCNPLHTVPTLVTPWGSLWESRAILRYIEASLPCPRLSPSGLYARAVVDRLLDWDLGTLYRAVSDIVYPAVFGGVSPSHDNLDALTAAVQFLNERQLGDGRPYLCGASLSIADISIAMTLSLLRLVDLEQLDNVPNMSMWLYRMTEIDGYGEIDRPFQAWIDQIHGSPRRGVKSPRRGVKSLIADVQAAHPSHALELDEQAFLGEEAPSLNDTIVAAVEQDAATVEQFQQDYAAQASSPPTPEESQLSPLEHARRELETHGGSVEGGRNTWTHLVAGIGRSAGVDVDVWILEMQAWNDRVNMPPLPREEVESIVRQSYARSRELHSNGPDTPTTSADGRPLDKDAPPP